MPEADAGDREPDVARLLETLDRHGVEYLLVGGVAARAHGAERLTKDLDCLARRTRANLDRLAAAMQELNARLRVDGLTDEEAAALPMLVDGARLASMEISTWRTDAGDMDVLADLPDRDGNHLSYEDLSARAAELRFHGIVVQVADIADVIASKEWADRPKDREALPELRRIRDVKRRT